MLPIEKVAYHGKPQLPPTTPSSWDSIVRVVALHATDSKITERRFRARFSPPQRVERDGGASVEEGEEGGDGAGERAVALCMELVHGEGCGVAEEANEVMRCAVVAVSCYCMLVLVLVLLCVVVREGEGVFYIGRPPLARLIDRGCFADGY